MTPERQERFQHLVEEHRRILYKICRSYGRTAADREDLAQEITVQLWRSFASFDDRYRFSTWMYRVALNVAISFVRRERTRADHVLSDDERVIEAVDDTGTPEAVQQLYALIDELDPLHKALILLYLDGYSYQEIAAVVGITETNVATRISRLKLTLQREAAAPEGRSHDRSR